MFISSSLTDSNLLINVCLHYVRVQPALGFFRLKIAYSKSRRKGMKIEGHDNLDWTEIVKENISPNVIT